MAHMDEGTLQAYLDNEAVARAEIDAHLAACTECAAKLAELRAASRLFAAAVHGTDVRAPLEPALAAVNAHRPQTPVLPLTRPSPRFARVPLARAAMLVIGLAAVASAAIPGSPVNALISGAIRLVTGDAETPVVPAPPANDAPAPVFDNKSELAAALSIQPVKGRVRVLLAAVAEDATVRVRLVDSDRATVQVAGAAARARFRTGPGRVEVVGIPGGEITIDLPRSVQDARVEIDGRVVFQKQRGQLHLSDPAGTGANSEFLFKP